MQPAIDAFRQSIERVGLLGGLHDALRSLTTNLIDPSDILRAQIVLIVSALDYYIHEITVMGMVDIFTGNRPSTNAFRKYPVPIDSVITASPNWFESEIRERHSFLSFQKPDKIADAIRLFSDTILWREVSLQMVMSEEDVKAQLKLIVDRRNKIAHEADIDPSYPGSRWPITKNDVDGALQFISRLCESIHLVVI